VSRILEALKVGKRKKKKRGARGEELVYVKGKSKRRSLLRMGKGAEQQSEHSIASAVSGG
jgi:hypothetical protein